MKTPTDFPLYIYLGKGGDKDMRLVTKFPNSAWVPRIGERLVLPEGQRSEATAWLLVAVELVVYDLVGQVVNVFCEKLKAGVISHKKTDLDRLFAELENSPNIDVELALLKASLTANSDR